MTEIPIKEALLKNKLKNMVENYLDITCKTFIIPHLKSNYTSSIYALRLKETPYNENFKLSRKMTLIPVAAWGNFKAEGLRKFSYGNYEVDLTKEEILNRSSFKTVENVFRIEVQDQPQTQLFLRQIDERDGNFGLSFHNRFLNKILAVESPLMIQSIMNPIYFLKYGYFGRKVFIAPLGGKFEQNFRAIKGLIFISSYSTVVHFIGYACPLVVKNKEEGSVHVEFVYQFKILHFEITKNSLEVEITRLFKTDFNELYGVSAYFYPNIM